MSTIFLDYPFQEQIKPATKNVQVIFMERSKGLTKDKRLTMDKAILELIMAFLGSNKSNMNNLGTQIPVDRNADGTKHAKAQNLLHLSSLISLGYCEH